MKKLFSTFLIAIFLVSGFCSLFGPGTVAYAHNNSEFSIQHNVQSSDLPEQIKCCDSNDNEIAETKVSCCEQNENSILTLNGLNNKPKEKKEDNRKSFSVFPAPVILATLYSAHVAYPSYKTHVTKRPKYREVRLE